MNQDLFLFQALSPCAKESSPSQVAILDQEGINHHHRQTILFGASLLLDEANESFI